MRDAGACGNGAHYVFTKLKVAAPSIQIFAHSFTETSRLGFTNKTVVRTI